MAQKKIVLKQIESLNSSPAQSKLKDLEQGDIYESFEAISVEEQRCEHPQRHWTLNEQVCGFTPTITGKCVVCGDKIEATPQTE